MLTVRFTVSLNASTVWLGLIGEVRGVTVDEGLLLVGAARSHFSFEYVDPIKQRKNEISNRLRLVFSESDELSSG